jgi:hypothetical protein
MDSVGSGKASITRRMSCFASTTGVDARVEDPNGNIQLEDILGAFRVEGGNITPPSYQMNDNHRIVSDKGLFRLHPTIHAELLKALQNFRKPNPGTRDATDPIPMNAKPRLSF